MKDHSSHEQPFVSILTPVYNGESYLAECIESVLAQTYRNFEYVIINNCSKDRTLEIAREYAQKDSRIRIHDNTQFVDVISNHNIAFGLIHDEARYCKVVSGDDIIFSTCLERLIQCAEANPTAGIIGCYQLSGSEVRWQGFKYPTAVFSGRELCRRIFVQKQADFGFGSPTSLLYRAEMVRRSRNFYPNLSPHSDTSACFRDLQVCDFGFVYEVLTYERKHSETQTSASQDLNRYSSAYIHDLIEYGPAYLEEEEVNKLVDLELKGYMRFLAVSRLFGSRGEDFWNYHKRRLDELGHPLKGFWFVRALLRTAAQEIANPERAVKKLLRRIPVRAH
jgi:glycosyltransferase involved in cell wall biosynthesis